VSEDLPARLRRLRRESGAGSEASASPDQDAKHQSELKSGKDEAESAKRHTSGAMPRWLVRRLRRKREQERRVAAAPSGPGLAPPTLAPRASGEPTGLVQEQGENGKFFARNTEYAAGDKHGDWALDEVDGADRGTIELLAGDSRLAQLDLRTSVFLDTETTGLGGGAGVYVYMIGLGYFDGDRFRLWQGFLRSPREERVLLAEVARRIRSASAVVSFFGKSFDRHRLDDKMAIAGIPSPFEELPHLDLYHPFQRLTRKRMVDGRLATMESQLCGLAREDDLPGAFAPEAWFDYLAERPHRLEGVFRHNRDDVLSLVTLSAYLGRVGEETRVDGRGLDGPPGARARGLARSHLERGERDAALAWVDRALTREREEGFDVRDLIFSRAELLRRLGRDEPALEAFAELAQGADDRWTLRGLVETAKILEHKLKDPIGARLACRNGLGLVGRVCTGRERERFERELNKREKRLTGKIE